MGQMPKQPLLFSSFSLSEDAQHKGHNISLKNMFKTKAWTSETKVITQKVLKNDGPNKY